MSAVEKGKFNKSLMTTLTFSCYIMVCPYAAEPMQKAYQLFIIILTFIITNDIITENRILGEIMTESDKLREIRKKIFLTAYPNKTAHLASAFSIAEIVYALYVKGILRYDISNPKWENRDRFILSKGHASLAVYIMLNEIGVLSDEQLSTFCRPGKSLGGEVNPNDCEWIEAATGSLGHGLGVGVGMATALKMDHSDAKVYVMVGNGELEEGVMWESVMSAKKFRLDNLIVILDDNKIQKMGRTDEIMGIESWDSKWESFGWSVDHIADGHNIEEIEKVLKKPNIEGTPRIVIADTVKGKGVSIVENNPDWHFKMPYRRELKYFMQELCITEEELERAKIVFNDIV